MIFDLVGLDVVEDFGHKEKSSSTACERGCVRMHTKEGSCKEFVNIVVLISSKKEYFNMYFMIPQIEGNYGEWWEEIEGGISDGKWL